MVGVWLIQSYLLSATFMQMLDYFTIHGDAPVLRLPEVVFSQATTT